MAKHRKHDLPDLRDGLEHVVYEIWKFKQSVVDYGPIQAVYKRVEERGSNDLGSSTGKPVRLGRHIKMRMPGVQPYQRDERL
jgi:hypothetical protein